MQILKIILGFIALIFATVGIFLPLLPTTPFVLVAIGCFSSTPKIRQKILDIAVFREYYESYVYKKPLPIGTVVRSLIFLWSMLIISMVGASDLTVTIILIAVGVAVSAHILVISRVKNL